MRVYVHTILFVNAKRSLLNINAFMLIVGEKYFLRFVSQNVAQLSVKSKLDRIREGCKYTAFSDLVLQRKVLMYFLALG